LKLLPVNMLSPPPQVAPRAGAWIETLDPQARYQGYDVAPRAGAWIETREKGQIQRKEAVAPRAGAWIETEAAMDKAQLEERRPPRGGVD